MGLRQSALLLVPLAGLALRPVAAASPPEHTIQVEQSCRIGHSAGGGLVVNLSVVLDVVQTHARTPSMPPELLEPSRNQQLWQITCAPRHEGGCFGAMLHLDSGFVPGSIGPGALWPMDVRPISVVDGRASLRVDQGVLDFTLATGEVRYTRATPQLGTTSASGKCAANGQRNRVTVSLGR